MSEHEINRCTCKNHDHKGWRAQAEFYAWCFIPKAWALEYKTLACHTDDRFMVGRK